MARSTFRRNFAGKIDAADFIGENPEGLDQQIAPRVAAALLAFWHEVEEK
jgi:hypothetical protein